MIPDGETPLVAAKVCPTTIGAVTAEPPSIRESFGGDTDTIRRAEARTRAKNSGTHTRVYIRRSWFLRRVTLVTLVTAPRVVISTGPLA